MEKKAVKAISEVGETVQKKKKRFEQFVGDKSRNWFPGKESPGTSCEFTETDSPSPPSRHPTFISLTADLTRSVLVITSERRGASWDVNHPLSP